MLREYTGSSVMAQNLKKKIMMWIGMQFDIAIRLPKSNMCSLQVSKSLKLFKQQLLCHTAPRSSAKFTNLFFIPFYFLYECMNFWTWDHFPAVEFRDLHGYLSPPCWEQNSGTIPLYLRKPLFSIKKRHKCLIWGGWGEQT